MGPGTAVKLLGSLVVGSEYSYLQLFLGLGRRKEGSRTIQYAAGQRCCALAKENLPPLQPVVALCFPSSEVLAGGSRFPLP